MWKSCLSSKVPQNWIFSSANGHLSSNKNIKTVYTIIFFERSTKDFSSYPEDYLHYFSQKSNTGLELDLLQKYFFIPLDIFRKIIHNKGIKTELDAWLTFLAVDEPEMIAALIQAFPDFKAMYEDIYELCQNIEGVMNMFSKELRELDQNTVQYMIDVMQDEIDEKKLLLEENKKILEELDVQLKEQDTQLKEQDAQLKAQLRINQLYSLLAESGLTNDLTRAITDKAYCEELLVKYSL